MSRREPDGTLACHADVSGNVNGLLNDMAVDSRGRAYVGKFGFDLTGGADLKPGSVFRVDPDGTVTTAAEDMWFPNGSVITPEEARKNAREASLVAARVGTARAGLP
jgi:sugar lactone lactonase YvrE